MANILYLVHRLPYPPNKGDKLRSYHLLSWTWEANLSGVERHLAGIAAQRAGQPA